MKNTNRLIFLMVCFLQGINGRCADSTFKFSNVFGTMSRNSKVFFDSKTQIHLADAISKGDTNKMHALIVSGADVNYSGQNGMKPLLWALVKQNLKSFRFLLQNGADPDVVADRNYHNTYSALMLAAGLKGSEYLQELLAHGAKPNVHAGYNQETAIFEASFYEKTNNIMILLKNGADIEAKNIGGQTPLIQAVNSHSFEMALFLYRVGANPSSKDNNGDSSVDLLKKFSNVTFTHADRDAYPRLLEELKKNGVIDGIPIK